MTGIVVLKREIVGFKYVNILKHVSLISSVVRLNAVLFLVYMSVVRAYVVQKTSKTIHVKSI